MAFQKKKPETTEPQTEEENPNPKIQLVTNEQLINVKLDELSNKIDYIIEILEK